MFAIYSFTVTLYDLTKFIVPASSISALSSIVSVCLLGCLESLQALPRLTGGQGGAGKGEIGWQDAGNT